MLRGGGVPACPPSVCQTQEPSVNPLRDGGGRETTMIGCVDRVCLEGVLRGCVERVC